MRYGLTQLVAPEVEVLDVGRAKEWLRISGDVSNELIARKIASIRGAFEREYGRQFITAVWRMTLPAFPCGAIRLPVSPVQAVTGTHLSGPSDSVSTTLGVSYYDGSNVLQTLASTAYDLSDSRDPGWICPAYGTFWPSTYPRPGAVLVTFTAGYGEDASDVPGEVADAIEFALADWLEHRGDDGSEASAVARALKRLQWDGVVR